ncbi:UNVERIFIED_CONTAM: hypothetical protein FKN15_018407 [Acipenser sinensis]
MTLREFQEALTDMLGSERWTIQMELLFNKVTDEELLNSGKIGRVQGASRLPWSQSKSFFSPTALYVDTSCDGYVDWDEFCTYMKLQYKEKDFSPASPSLLLWGDDIGGGEDGGVNLMWFLKPHTGFTEEQGLQKVFMQSKIMYLTKGDLIITSSGSTSTSVVIMDLNRKNKCLRTLVLKFPCVLEYGGVPFLLLKDPLCALLVSCRDNIGMLKLEQRGAWQDMLFTHSAKLSITIYNPFFRQCLRTLVLKFPCVLEYGGVPFLLLKDPLCALLVSCRDYIGMLKLEQRGAWQDMLFTHSAKLSITIYNPFFRQVVIGCGCVGRGDGDKVSPAEQRPRARGDDRHVLRHHADTAYHRNGTIKVWNVQNGHNLHKLEPEAEAEVTRVLCYQDHKFLAVGSSRQLALYNTTDHRNTYVVADLSWRGGQLHKEDILAADSCPVLELLTMASFDEDIIAWNTETQQVQAQVCSIKLVLEAVLDPPLCYALGFKGCPAAGTDFQCSVGQGPLKKPSLLYSWRAHNSTVVSVELLSYDSESFLVNASADKTAWLWTSDGKYMGTIGHEKWSLKNPATYQHPQ